MLYCNSSPDARLPFTEDDCLYTLREASVLLGLSTVYLRRLNKRGVIRCVRPGTRNLYVSGREIRRLLERADATPCDFSAFSTTAI